MNSKVLNYLSDKKDNFMDWFESNKTNIKTNATKVIATGLTLAALTNMAGCSGNASNEQNNIADDNVIIETIPNQDQIILEEERSPFDSLKPRDQIEQDGITAQDVLDVCNNLVVMSMRTHYPASSSENLEFYNICTPTSQTSISDTHSNDTLPFYPFYEKYQPYSNPLSSFNSPTFTNVYKIHITGKTTDSTNLDDASKSSYTSLPIVFSKEDFERVAKAFGLDIFKIDQQYASDVLLEKNIDISGYIGTKAIAGQTINRDNIMNATEDQLWIIYDAVINTSKLNFPYQFSNSLDIGLNLEPSPQN